LSRKDRSIGSPILVANDIADGADHLDAVEADVSEIAGDEFGAEGSCSADP
jgi:hypothetical protein